MKLVFLKLYTIILRKPLNNSKYLPQKISGQLKWYGEYLLNTKRGDNREREEQKHRRQRKQQDGRYKPIMLSLNGLKHSN